MIFNFKMNPFYNNKSEFNLKIMCSNSSSHPIYTKKYLYLSIGVVYIPGTHPCLGGTHLNLTYILHIVPYNYSYIISEPPYNIKCS